MEDKEKDYAREQAAAQYESIQQMLAAVELDYDRLDELRESESLTQEEAAELKELEEAADGCEDADDARDRLNADPLDIQVRSGWANPGEPLTPEEFMILLCTGGPAVRIIGELDENGYPSRARLQYQDWFTPWIEYIPAQSDVLCEYAAHFFGC